jgi:hypothetical protein
VPTAIDNREIGIIQSVVDICMPSSSVDSSVSYFAITHCIYSYSNITKTGNCRCKTGYEFKINPPIPVGRLSVTGKDNLFTESSSLAKEGKELQCVIEYILD